MCLALWDLCVGISMRKCVCSCAGRCSVDPGPFGNRPRVVGKGGGCVGGVALLSSYWCDGKLASTLLWYRGTGQYGMEGWSKDICISVVIVVLRGTRRGVGMARVAAGSSGGWREVVLQHQDRGCSSKPDGAGRGGAVALDPERVKPSPCARQEHARGWVSGGFVESVLGKIINPVGSPARTWREQERASHGERESSSLLPFWSRPWVEDKGSMQDRERGRGRKRKGAALAVSRLETDLHRRCSEVGGWRAVSNW